MKKFLTNKMYVYEQHYVYSDIEFKAKSIWKAICKNLHHKTGGSGIDSR